MFGSMMTGSPDTFMSLFMTLELLSFLPLINMKLTEHQVDLLVGSSQLNNIPDFLNGLECSSPQDPRRNYDFDCTNLLKVAQKDLLFLSGIGLFFLGAWLLSRIGLGFWAYAGGLVMKVLPLMRRVLLSIMLDSLVKATYSAPTAGVDSARGFFNWVFVLIVWLFFIALGGLSLFFVFSEASAYPRLKHFLFDNLKPTVLSRLYLSLLILHRASFAMAVVAFDLPIVQLIVITSTSFMVLPRQFGLYLVVVRPFSNTKDSILQVGCMAEVFGFCLVLTLFELGSLGDDSDLVTTALFYTLLGTIFLHIAAMLLNIGLTVRSILLEKEPTDLIAVI
jgi:hypothetical protein